MITERNCDTQKRYQKKVLKHTPSLAAQTQCSLVEMIPGSFRENLKGKGDMSFSYWLLITSRHIPLIALKMLWQPIVAKVKIII